MKSVLTLAAAAIVAGLAATAPAHAFMPPSWTWSETETGEQARFYPDEAGYAANYHPTCVGLSSGTAHHSCGTRTGGPSGGLN